jgi:hypothetical protein
MEEREAPPQVRTALLRSTVLELLALENPRSVRELEGEGEVRIEAVFAEAMAAVRSAFATRRHLLAEAARWKREPQATIAVAASAKEALELAERGAAGSVLLDDSTQSQLSQHIVAVTHGELFEAVALRQEPPRASAEPDAERRGQRAGLEEALALVGAAAGLAAWVALTGGLTMWARFNAAHLPALEGVAILPRSTLVAEGVRTLALPLLLGGLAAMLAYLAAARSPRAGRRKRLWSGGTSLITQLKAIADALGIWFVIAAAALGLPFLLLLQRYGFHERWWAFPFLALLTLIAAAALVAAVAQIDRPIALGITTLAAVAVWSGAAGIVWEYASLRPRLDHATLTLVGGASADTLFIARTSDTVYVARTDPRAGGACRIQVLPVSAVADLRIGGRANEGFCPTGNGQAVVTGPKMRTVTLAARTTTVTRGTVTIAPATVTLPADTVTVPSPPLTVTMTETVAAPRPAGAHRVNGIWSIPVASVQSPDRLAISAPHFARAPLTDTNPLTVTFTISDARGYRVEGARVFLAGSRSIYFRSTARATSVEDGTVKLVLHPTDRLPFGKGVRVALLVRAWNGSEPLLAGVSTRRFVELHLGERSR